MHSDVTVDSRGLTCPGPVVNAARQMREMQPGQVLELWADAEGTHSDLPAWAEKSGNEFLGEEAADSYTRYFVRKTS